ADRLAQLHQLGPLAEHLGLGELQRLAARGGGDPVERVLTSASDAVEELAHGRPPCPARRPPSNRLRTRRWRNASKTTTVPAMATLSDSARPGMGMLTSPSRRLSRPGGRPRASPPTTMATGPVRSTSSTGAPPRATA